MTEFLIDANLARLSLKSGLALPFALWSILRFAAKTENLSGHYSKDFAIKKIMNFGQRFTTRHWSRIWKRGEGIFWNCENKRVHVRSFKHVLTRLQELTNDKELLAGPANSTIQIKWSSGIENLNAELYGAWFAARGEITIARDSLKDLFNLSHDQQRRYETILGARLLVKSNYAHINAAFYAQNPQELPEHHFTIEYERFLPLEDDYEATKAIQYQLPNTYIFSSRGKDESSATRTSNRENKAIRTLHRHAYTLCDKMRLYCGNFRDFELHGDSDSFVRCYYQGTKRLWLSGHYS